MATKTKPTKDNPSARRPRPLASKPGVTTNGKRIHGKGGKIK